MKLGDAWEMGTLGSFISARIAQLNETPMINQVDHYVRLTRNITLPPMQVHKMVGVAKILILSKRLNLMTESLPAREAIEGVEAVPSYKTFKRGGNRVTIGLQNLTQEKIILKKGIKITRVSAANIVPPMLVPDLSTDRNELEYMHNGVDSESIPEYKKLDSQEVKKPEPTPERLDNLFSKLDLSGIQEWSEDLQQKVHDLVVKYQHLFALNDLELGKTAKVKHEIKLSNPVPFKDRYHRIRPHEFEEVRNHLQDMLKVGAIRKSVSLWASPVVLVQKKDGLLRFCIDLRKLNSRTIKDAYSLPRIEESLDCLNGAIKFTSVDLKAGYWQVEMEESSIPYTSFTVGPLGFCECVRVPFGLSNAPATFQHLMESCLGDYHLKYCIIYLDDIIIFSKTPEEHINSLGKVFQKLDEAGLRLKPGKCELFQDRLEYLGYVVYIRGIETSPKKIAAILNWPQPQNITQVRSFLGFCNYYRKFIRGYAQVAKPLYQLLMGENAKKKTNGIEWTEQCEQAFNKLKGICSDTPVLAYADYRICFKVHTDASEQGLGAVLYQDQDDGTIRVIAYASRNLTKSEKRYHSSKLEFLALKWSICERFHEYLYGGKFQVYTDNNPLMYILTTAKLDATGQWWVASLANYDFTIYYCSDKQNIEADALSRIQWQHEDEVQVKAILARGFNADTTIPIHFDSNPIQFKNIQIDTTPKMGKDNWIQEQASDEDIGPMVKLV